MPRQKLRARKQPGQLIPRGTGRDGLQRWLIRVYLHREGGRRVYCNRTVAGTKAEAVAELAKLRSLHHAKQLMPRSRLTVDAFLTEWLTAARPSVRPRVAEGYAELARLYLRPNLGSGKLANLTAQVVQAQLVAPMVAAGLSPRTVRHAIGLLKNALGWAEANGLISSHPLANRKALKLPAWAETERAFWTPAEAQQFLTVADQDGLAALWRLALNTGLRPSEFLALT